MRFSRTLLAGLVILAASLPAFGQLTQIATPTAGYTGSTTEVLIPSSIANSTSVSGLPVGTPAVSFSPSLVVYTVGGGWSAWGSPPATEGSTPRVLFTNGQTSVTITLATPTTTFGLEAEPDSGTHTITASFRNGSTVLGPISASIGQSTAQLLAASSTQPITSVVVSSDADFAIGRIRYVAPPAAPVPALSTTAMIVMGVLLAAMAAWFSWMNRRRTA